MEPQNLSATHKPLQGSQLPSAHSQEYESVPDTPSKEDAFPLVPLRAAASKDSPSPGSHVAPHDTTSPKRHRLRSFVQVARVLLLPFIVLGYLAFCYAAHSRVIPLNAKVFDENVGNLAIIKSGVTTVSILLISLGLLPIQGLISELRSEELFRGTSRVNGVPLRSVNNISNQTFGFFDTITVLLRRHCSPYFLAAFVAGLLTLGTSALAPAALSVSTALFDGDLIELEVGAVLQGDVLNITDAFTTPVLSATAVRIYPRAAALAWAETQLNMTYSFEVANGPHYIVPTPVNLPRDVHASWLSDVAVMQPQCEWVDPEQKTYSTATGLSGTINVISPKHKLNITVQPATDLPSVGATVSVKATIYYDIHDLPENQVTVSGVMVWLVARCSQDCPEVIGLDLDFDLSGIPQIQVPIKEFNDSAPPNLYQVAFLVCSPNAEVTTREVRNDGRGRLTVSDLDFPSQGNLLPSQTNVLFSNALSTVSFTGGELPNNLQPSLGTETQAALFFGLDTTNLNTSTSIPPLKPLPLENITAGYARLLHSASKAFLGGGLSKANVPGCLATERVVFTSSLPQAIVSTVLFLLLWAIAAASYLRSESPQFSLFSVAASLNGSDIPQVMGHIRSAAMPDMNEKDMVAKLGARAVVATSRENGPVLLLQ